MISLLDYRSFVIVVGVVVGVLVYELVVTRQEPCCGVNVTTTTNPSEFF